jgi:hypothetical protein
MAKSVIFKEFRGHRLIHAARCSGRLFLIISRPSPINHSLRFCRRRSSEHIQSSGSSEMTAGLKGSVRKLQFNLSAGPKMKNQVRKPCLKINGKIISARQQRLKSSVMSPAKLPSSSLRLCCRLHATLQKETTGTKCTTYLLGTIQFRHAFVQAPRNAAGQGYDASIPQAKPLSPGEVLGCTSPSLHAHEMRVMTKATPL